jgi:hypothetical protein
LSAWQARVPHSLLVVLCKKIRSFPHHIQAEYIADPAVEITGFVVGHLTSAMIAPLFSAPIFPNV